MGRIMDKEEFKLSLMAAELEKAAENGEEIIKVAKENEPGDKETEPVAAGRKKRRSKKDAVMEEAVSEAIAKSNKQTEALRAAIQVMIDYTDGLTLKADKLINLADIYSGYIKTLEEMTK